MSKLNISGLIGNNQEVNNAHTIEITETLNGSGDDSFGGAERWPVIRAEVSFQAHEGQRAVAFAKKLSELVKQEFALQANERR